MLLGIDLLTALVLDPKFSEHVIIIGDRPYKGCSAPMADVTDYKLTTIMDNIIKLEEYFINL